MSLLIIVSLVVVFALMLLAVSAGIPFMKAGVGTHDGFGTFARLDSPMSVNLLLSQQNRDGGWPYVRGASWTEPTVYAVLALLSAGENAPAQRGLEWLRSLQLRDGGWPPQTGFDESNWVTALTALAPPAHLGAQEHERAIRWILTATGEESTAVFRLRRWLLGESPKHSEPQAGPG